MVVMAALVIRREALDDLGLSLTTRIFASATALSFKDVAQKTHYR